MDTYTGIENFFERRRGREEVCVPVRLRTDPTPRDPGQESTARGGASIGVEATRRIHHRETGSTPCHGEIEFSMSGKKAKRLLALDRAKAGSKGPSCAKRGPASEETRREKRGRTERNAERREGTKERDAAAHAPHAARTSRDVSSTLGHEVSSIQRQQQQQLLYATFDGVTETFPWLARTDTDHGSPIASSLPDLVQSLLRTNYRYANSSTPTSAVIDKMKEKTLLLENPVGQNKTKKSSRLGAFYPQPGARVLGRKALKSKLSETGEGRQPTYADALVLHGLWRGYRDDVLGEPTKSKQEAMERVWGMEKVGGSVEVVWCENVSNHTGKNGRRPVKGIVLEATATSLHVIEESGKVRIVDTRGKGCEVRLDVGGGRVARFHGGRG